MSGVVILTELDAYTCDGCGEEIRKGEAVAFCACGGVFHGGENNECLSEHANDFPEHEEVGPENL
jgi:hypothetical protein